MKTNKAIMGRWFKTLWLAKHWFKAQLPEYQRCHNIVGIGRNFLVISERAISEYNSQAK